MSAVIYGVPVKQFEHRSVRRKQIVLALKFLCVEKEISWHSVSLSKKASQSFGNRHNSQNKKCKRSCSVASAEDCG